MKVNKDPEEVERRKKLCQERTPMELGNIGSLSELPIPAPIQNLFSKSDADKPEKPQRKNMEEKRKYGHFVTSARSFCSKKTLSSGAI